MHTSLILLLSPAVVAGVPFDASAHFPYGPFGTLDNVEHHFIDPAKAKAAKDVKVASNHKNDHSYDNHFVSLGKANNNKKVMMVRNNKKMDVSAPAPEEEHYPYEPIGAKPYEHHWVQPKTKKDVKMVRNNDKKDASTFEEERYPYEPIGAKPYEHHWIQPKAKKDVRMVSTNSITDLPNPDDFQEAQDAVFEAVEKAERGLFRFAKRCEQAAEHAIEDEVNVMFCKDKKKPTDATATANAKAEGDPMADPDAIFHALEKMYD